MFILPVKNCRNYYLWTLILVSLKVGYCLLLTFFSYMSTEYNPRVWCPIKIFSKWNFQVCFFFFIYFDFLSFQDYTYSNRENENCHFVETVEEQNLSVNNFSLFWASNKEGSMVVASFRLYHSPLKEEHYFKIKKIGKYPKLKYIKYMDFLFTK